MDFAPFDKRGYPIVSAQTGYREWAGNYDATVAAGLDRPLLDALKSIYWDDIKAAADLACGTGRTGVGLSQHGVPFVDGVDKRRENARQSRSAVQTASWGNSVSSSRRPNGKLRPATAGSDGHPIAGEFAAK